MEKNTLEFRSISDKDIEARLLALNEDDFSKSILVPLFSTIYGGRVEFVGGRVEKGRDILIHKEDELGDYRCIAVQVKKIKWGENSSKNCFSTLLTQLRQANEEPVIRWDGGNEALVHSFIFVTPHFIGQRVLDSHRGAFKKAVDGKEVKILDGRKIAELIKKHKPNLLQCLFDHNLGIAENIYGKLNNSDLMTAMGVSKLKDIKKIYCQSNFIIGGVHYEKYIENTLKSVSEVGLRLKGEEIEGFIVFTKEIEALVNTNILVAPRLEDLEDNISQQKRYKEALRKLNKETRDFLESIEKRDDVSLDLKSFAIEAVALAKERDILSILTRSNQLLRGLTNDNPIVGKINSIRKLLEECNELKDRIEENSVSITIKLGSFVEAIEKAKSQLSDGNFDTMEGVAEYLDTVEFLIRCFKAIHFYESFLDFIPNEKQTLAKSKIFLDKVFNTRKNISVLGDAGSGKTTNLKMHAVRVIEQSRDRFVVFSTLSAICASAVESGSKKLLFGIFNYYRQCSIDLSIKEIDSALRSGNATVILDSVDEAIGEHSWVINAILEFSREYTEAQIIISSRFSIDEIREIPFAHVSLLPFDKSQKEEFFKKWFAKDSIAAEEILDHLKVNQELDTIVVNPLSATILCVLKESGVTLPDSETTLYKERFNLLAGKFDASKGISRLTTPSDDLINAAQFLALEVHKQHSKDFSREDMQRIILDSQKDISVGAADKVVNDLILSEIVVPESLSKFSFGHLRYQEYLVSREVLSNREFRTQLLFSDPWWADVVGLYAKEARSVKWLINYAVSNGIVSMSKKLLNDIVVVRPEKERDELIATIRAAIIEEINPTDLDEEFSSDVYMEDLESLTHPLDSNQ